MDLTGFISKILEKLSNTSDKSIIAKLVDDRSIKLWEIAFTHESYDPNFGKNYEELELLGDAVIKLIFIDYLMARFPNINKGEASQLVINTLKGYVMNIISDKYGFPNYIRTRIPISIKLKEDVFESFFGALYKLGNEQIKFGAGYVLCSAVLFNILNDIDINYDELSKANPKTVLIGYFNRLNWKKPIEEYTKSKEEEVLTIKLTNEAITYLRDNNIIINNPILAQVRGHYKKALSNEAYKLAIKKLESMGLKEEWFESQRFNLEMNNPLISDYYTAALNKATTSGYSDILLKTYVSDKGIYAVLIGIKPDNYKEVLAIGSDNSIILAKRNVLMNYLSAKPDITIS